MNSQTTTTLPPSIGPVSGPMFHVVLHEPEIPNNTGNIGRTCVALDSALHLIEPIGFDISEHAVRRAGLDYWRHVSLHTHANWERYKADAQPSRLWLVSTKATRTVFDASFQPGDHLVFGKETAGLPRGIREQHPDQCVRLPMAPNQRSLNLATAVCTVMYEAVRQGLHTGRLFLNSEGYICQRAEPDVEVSRIDEGLDIARSFLLSK